MADEWFVMVNDRSWLNTVLFRLERPYVLLVKIDGWKPGVARSMVIGTVSAVDPEAVPGTRLLVDMPWGRAYLFTPPGADNRRKAVVLDRYGLLAHVDDPNDVREIRAITMPERRQKAMLAASREPQSSLNR